MLNNNRKVKNHPHVKLLHVCIKKLFFIDLLFNLAFLYLQTNAMIYIIIFFVVQRLSTIFYIKILYLYFAVCIGYPKMLWNKDTFYVSLYNSYMVTLYVFVLIICCKIKICFSNTIYMLCVVGV